jgi:hypothetical protein
MAEEIKTDFGFYVGNTVRIYPVLKDKETNQIRGKYGKIIHDAKHNVCNTMRMPEHQFRYRVLLYTPIYSKTSKMLIWAQNFSASELRKVDLPPNTLNVLTMKQKTMMILDNRYDYLVQDED